MLTVLIIVVKTNNNNISNDNEIFKQIQMN